MPVANSSNITTIQILRSYSNTTPLTLQDGQLAYSFKSNTLFIGSNTGSVIVISDQATANLAANLANSKVSKSGDRMTGSLQFFGPNFAIGQYDVVGGIDLWANNNTSHAQLNFANTNFAYVDGFEASLQTPNSQILAYTSGNVEIFTSTDGSVTRDTWTFDTDGTLTVPGPIRGLGNSKLDFTTYGSNTAYLTTTNDDTTALFMGTATAELYADTSIQIRANTGGTSKAWTFGAEGTLTFPDNTIQTTAYTPGGEIDELARATANAAYFHANGAFIRANAAFSQANVTIGVDAGQNNRMTIIEGTDLSQNVRLDFSNTRMTISDGVNTSQNVRLDFSNTRMAISDGVNTSQNVRLDFSNTRMDISDGVNVGQNNRMTIIEGTDTSQNVRLNFSNTRMDISDGVNASQNSRLDFSNTRMTIIEGVNVTQNTDIANKLSLSGASYQTVSGNVAFLNDVSVSGNLIVLGNTISLNVTSLEVKDTLIQLGIGNYNTDVLTIGYVGHYNDGTNAQAGMIRDAGTKEFYAFQGYTPGVTGNTVNINDASFAKANIHGNWFKGNLIATTARVGGLDVNSRLDFSNTRMDISDGVNVSQNVRLNFSNTRMDISDGVNLSQNVRIDYSNTAFTITQGVDNSQNVRLDFSNTRMTIIEGVDAGQNARMTIIEGTDTSQNARMTIIEGTDASQNVRLDFSNTRMAISDGVDASQNVRIDYSNTALTIAQGVDNSQNVRLDFSNTRMTIIEGTDTSQNARMTIIEGTDLSQNVRLDFSNTRMTIIEGVDAGQNARMSISDGVNASQNVRLDFSNTRMAIIEGVDVTQNTNISTVTALAQAAFNRANTEPDSFSYLANTVVVANSTGYLSNSSVFFTSSNNNLIVSGNVQVSNGSITTPATELTLGQTGDTFGATYLRMQNRGGQNGPLFDGTSSSVALVDFGFKTVNGQRNIRYETRGGYKYISSGDGLEFQIGDPNAPTFVISNNSVYIAKTTTSTSTTTGALIVGGGAGIAGNVYSGMHYITGSGNGIVFVDSTVQTTAGSSVANTVYLQGVDNSQNVRLDFSNTRMNIIDGVDAGQNSRMIIIEGTDTSQNARMAIIEGTNASQNVRIDYSNAAITIIQGTDTTQNTRLTVIEGTDASQNVRLDYSNTAITIIQGVDVTQNTRLTVSEGVDLSQNVRLDFSNTRMNIIDGVDAGQNARMTIIEGVDATQNTNISNKLSLTGASLQTVTGNVVFGNDVTVTGNLIILGNTISLNVSSLEVEDTLIQLGIGNYYTDALSIGYVGHYNDGTNAHAGFIRDAVTKEFYAFQGYTPETTGNVINVNAASFTKANIHGNWFKGNLIATTARVGGLDINSRLDFSNTRMTIIEGVDVTQNTNIAATDNKMQGAYNVANTADVRSVAAYFHANGAFIKANAAFDQANVTIGVDASQNVRIDYSNTAITIAQGVDNSQNVRIDFSNTRMTIIEGTDVSQNARMTIADGVDASQNVRLDYSNTALTIAQGVDNSQNVRLDFSNTAINATDGKMASAYNQANTGTVLAQAAFNRANTEPDSFNYLANTIVVANSAGYLSNSNVFFISSNNTLLVTSNTVSTSNTTGSLVVSGGVGITGNLFMSAANNFFLTTNGAQSYRLGWTDNYFMRSNQFGGAEFTGNFLNINSNFYTTSSYIARGVILNDTGNNTVIFAGSSPVRIQNTAASISNTTGSLIVDGGLGLSGNLSMNLSSSGAQVNRLTLTQAAYMQAYTSAGNIEVGGGGYWYFNTGPIYNQSILYQRGVIANDTGNTTVLFAGSSQVKIQNGTASSNTTTGALVVQGGVGISGALNATTKSFNIPHPTKEGKDLRYGSLEGPEFGVYIRGTLKGSNIIELPDYWTKLVDANTITVSLTPIGKHQKLSVKEVKDNTIIINSDGWFKKEIHCYYVVYGERADVDKLDVEG